MSRIRRVVTGIDSSGTSVFVSDELVEAKAPPVLGGVEILDLFGSDETAVVPNDGRVEEGLLLVPTTPAGHRFTFYTYPPDSEIVAPEDFERAIEETKLMAPGLIDIVLDEEGLHYTPTVDLEYIVAGEFTLTLENGVSKVLKAGDCLVQCGAKHAWANKGDVPATLLLVFVGAKQDDSRFGRPKDPS